MIAVVIFDLDNTLTDFMRMKESAVDAAVDAMIDAGLMLPAQTIKDRIYDVYDKKGIEFQGVFDDVLNQLLGEVNHKVLAAGVVAYRRAREAALVLYPHVRVTLFELIKRGLRLAVITDAPRKEGWLRLCYLQLHHMFEKVLTFEDTGERKPSPVPFKTVLEHFAVQPQQAMMVGDWPERDISGAAQLGIITVFARYGDRAGVTESGAKYEIDDIIELVKIVDNHNSKK
ncbi:MAG: HAD-IA family hydrolase [Candidatus Krumholzibacteria bacterium]|nr:HAD-IA family hydrolase [Candidatus Krumholzibacteria bacterium]